MGKYVKVADSKDVPKNTIRAFKVNGREVLIANVNGKFYAVENRCPHKGYPLYFGSLEGEFITCGFHYERFNVKTGRSSGKVTHKPLETFETKIQNSTISIKIDQES